MNHDMPKVDLDEQAAQEMEAIKKAGEPGEASELEIGRAVDEAKTDKGFQRDMTAEKLVGREMADQARTEELNKEIEQAFDKIQQ